MPITTRTLTKGVPPRVHKPKGKVKAKPQAKQTNTTKSSRKHIASESESEEVEDKANTSPPRSNHHSGVLFLLLKNSRLLGRRNGMLQNMPCTKTLSLMALRRLRSIIQSLIRSPVLF